MLNRLNYLLVTVVIAVLTIAPFRINAGDSNDKFKVFQVKGKVNIKSTNTPVKPMDLIDINDNFDFREPNSMIVAFSPSNGRVCINEKGRTFQATSNVRLGASRGLILNSLDVNKVNQFMIINEVRHTPNQIAITDTNAQRFRITYKYKNKFYSRDIHYTRDNKLILSRAALFPKDVDPYQAEEIAIHYEDANDFRQNEICSFLPLFPDENLLMQEIKTFKQSQSLSNSDEEGVFDILCKHIESTFFCTLNREDFKAFMKARSL
ncbi:MAG: hypothetical protein RML72_01230 [Bacteroidia bacterium]|nr:hypothetical protein [Bacteroidia bacterium]MDW8157483.1 hypothetical protein [Bacteroidia bacterium]